MPRQAVLFGDNEDIAKSIGFISEYTPADKWIEHLSNYKGVMMT